MTPDATKSMRERKLLVKALRRSETFVTLFRFGQHFGNAMAHGISMPNVIHR
jgi:hypothetical protein